MPELVERRCPQCGRTARDNFLAQCPDCWVPFVAVAAANYPHPVPSEPSRLAGQLLGSWQIWVVILILIGASAAGIITVTNKLLLQKTAELNRSLAEQSTNHLRLVTTQISNQIALQFKKPAIRSAIDEVARSRANDLFVNGVKPAVDDIEAAVNAGILQLTALSNQLASLQSQSDALQKKIQQLTNELPSQIPTNSAPVSVAPPVAAAPPVSAATASSSVKLTLTDNNISHVNGIYVLTCFFHVANPGSPTTVDILAGVYKQSRTKILNFSSLTSNTSGAPVVDSSGDFARLKLLVANGDNPVLVLELTGSTIVRLGSDSFDNDITIPVAALRNPASAATNR